MKWNELRKMYPEERKMTWNELRKEHPWLPSTPDGYHQHENGGGWVSDNSIVSPDKYIGPDTIVDSLILRSIKTCANGVTDAILVIDNRVEDHE